ncbi:glycosyl transferase family 2 [Williamsia limnetica]|uniref:Glycosyl transferase family 2 n=2 Tax=Williamsia limnetica TaxID=882452 RepID=A0A318RHS6_WILLI|nr:glycosyl transferase family 2 [Williamsia limnetica]
MLPFYGDMSLFQAAVRSVLAQSHAEFRLVMVDDQYPDPEPARWFQELGDSRLQYLRNAENLGVNGNFRRCVDLAEAPVFTIMGCDDLMGPDHLARAVAALATHPDAAVAASGVEVIDADGAVVRPLGDRVKSTLAPRAATTLRGEELAAGLYRGNWTYFPSLLWRRDVARQIGFREGLEVVLDLALLVDIARAGGSLVFDPDVTFAYRRHVGSVSSVRAIDGRRFTEEREFFTAEARTCEELGWTTAAKAARRHPTSRLNAATLLPGALVGRQWPVAGELARHLVR